MSYYKTENTFLLLNNFLNDNLNPEMILEHPMIVDWMQALEEELSSYVPHRREYFVRKLNRILAVIKKNTDTFKDQLIATLPLEGRLCS